MTEKKVKFGALPTENMPKKSHETPKPPRRPAREIVKEVPTSASNKKYYKGLTDICKRITGLKRLLMQHCHAGKNRNQFDFTWSFERAECWCLIKQTQPNERDLIQTCQDG